MLNSRKKMIILLISIMFFSFSCKKLYSSENFDEKCIIQKYNIIEDLIEKLDKKIILNNQELIIVLNNMLYFMKTISENSEKIEDNEQSKIKFMKKIWYYYYKSYPEEPEGIDPRFFKNYSIKSVECNFKFIDDNLLISDIELLSIKCENQETKLLYCPYKLMK